MIIILKRAEYAGGQYSRDAFFKAEAVVVVDWETKTFDVVKDRHTVGRWATMPLTDLVAYIAYAQGQ